MGRIYPINDNCQMNSASLYAACASNFFPALNSLVPAGTFRETSSGLDSTSIGIVVNLRTHGGNQITNRQLLDGVIQEIQLRCGSRSRRPVHSLHLRLPTDAFDIAEITELVYHLSRHFRLAHKGIHRFCAQISNRQVNDNTLALLKGLGFNHLQLDVAQTCNPEMLQQQLSRAREYQFQTVSLTVEGLNEPLVDQLSQLAAMSESLLDHVQLNLSPLAWSESSQKALQEEACFRRLFNYFRDHGFRVIGNDCFVQRDHLLAKAQLTHTLRRTPLSYNADGITDICGLGPGALTRENHHYYRNIPSASGYLQRTRACQSPVSHAHTLTYQHKLMELVIDQLLCFHQLDLDYLRSRYQIHTDQLVTLLMAGIECYKPVAPWINCSSNYLTLTVAGIFHLHHICHIIDQSAALAFPSLNHQR